MFKVSIKKFFKYWDKINTKQSLRVSGNRVVRKGYTTLTIDGFEIKAPVGEILAVTLFVNGILTLKYSSRKKEPRGLFCLMGSCQECLVLVNDRIVLACQEIVEEGIIIKTGINKWQKLIPMISKM